MCLRPRLPQLPARHKPPTLHPEHKKTFKRRIAKLLVSLPGPLVKHGSSLQRGLRFCLCVTVNVHLFRLVFKTSPSLLAPRSRFLSRHSLTAWFRFYSCERTDKYSLCTSRLGETFPHMPSTAILLLTPSGTIKRQITPLYSAHVSVILPIILKYFLSGVRFEL